MTGAPIVCERGKRRTFDRIGRASIRTAARRAAPCLSFVRGVVGRSAQRAEPLSIASCRAFLIKLAAFRGSPRALGDRPRRRNPRKEGCASEHVGLAGGAKLARKTPGAALRYVASTAPGRPTVDLSKEIA